MTPSPHFQKGRGLSTIPRNELATNSHHQSPAISIVAAIAANDRSSSSSSSVQHPLKSHQDHESSKEDLLLQLTGPEDNDLSDGDNSTDTIELTQRLKKKLRPSTNKGSATTVESQELPASVPSPEKRRHCTTLKEPCYDAATTIATPTWNDKIRRHEMLVTCDNTDTAGDLIE